MLRMDKVRNFSKVGDAAPVPNLIDIQLAGYDRFLQKDPGASGRKAEGLEALLREIFPIVSYDKQIQLEYISYELGESRYAPQECRDLRLTYGMPFRIRCRLVRTDRKEVLEESIYVGEVPIMIGGGEFIINGAERVIVSQLHRSPGVDFTVEMQESDRPLHGARIIPERGSWIEMTVTKKDALTIRIDQSSKIPSTMFLRSMDPKYSTDADIIREFYKTRTLPVDKLRVQMYVVEPFVDPDTGEEILPAGGQIGEALTKIVSSPIKKLEVIEKVADPLILNTLMEDPSGPTKDRTGHEDALLRIYMRLRPGNPPQIEKAKTLFAEKFYDENRYRLGKVGRFRINRKFHQAVDESVMTLRPEDFVGTLKYILNLRSGDGVVDDIDHLGNRRLRTIDELATDELRKGFLKLRRTVQERMSLKNPDELTKIAELVNSKSISSSIDYFFGRGELSQVVDTQNALSQLTHERRLSALGPGGLNRKRAGFEVRDVHISHYGRICPIETPEGNNIGLISSLGIYAGVDEYGFLTTPYRKVEKGEVTNKIVYLRADEEMETILAPPNAMVLDGDKRPHLPKENVLARDKGELGLVEGVNVQYVDISPKQTVGVSAALVPFLEHDDANRALMGANMQRQAVPLIRTEAPIVSTGMERAVVENSGMVAKARKAGTVTYVDARRVVIDNADEYELRKFCKLNERTCLNQKPIVVEGQRVKKGQIIADGSGCCRGELALGRNILVAFMPFDGYNFEDAIVISQELVKQDAFTSIHLEEYDVEIRETKLGREEFTRDIPNISERALRNLDANGVVRVGTRVQPGDILVGKVSPKSKSELSPEEKLLHAIFGRAGEDVKNDSLDLPAGEEGVVVDTRLFSRRMHMTEDQKKDLARDMKAFEKQMNARMVKVFRLMAEEIGEVLGVPMVDPSTRQKVGQSDIDEVILEQIENFNVKWIKVPKSTGYGSAEPRTSLIEPELEAFETLLIRDLCKKAEKPMFNKKAPPAGKAEDIVTQRGLRQFYNDVKKSIGDNGWHQPSFSGELPKSLPNKQGIYVFRDKKREKAFDFGYVGLAGRNSEDRYRLSSRIYRHFRWDLSGPTRDIDNLLRNVAEHLSVDGEIDRCRKQLGKIPDDNQARKAIEDYVIGNLEFTWVVTEGEPIPGGSRLVGEADRQQGEKVYERYWPRIEEIRKEAKRRLEHMKRGDELPSGVLEMVKVRVATKRTLGVGDKMAGRHGNKGVIARIVPREDMPYMEDGTPVGIVLNPLGVPGRMNLGQILETHLGWAAAVMGYQAVTPVFDGATEQEIMACIGEANEYVRKRRGDIGVVQSAGATGELLVEMPEDGKVRLHDGRTGEPFEQKTTVGYIYMNKLHHLVDEKIHARATGPYSLITQQPLGGKARTGGQRFGEMEVWGLEAYGASYTLQELLTVKSDDVEGRTKIYESMVKGTNTLEAGTPVSFDVLCNELRGLGLNITLEKRRLI